jgi:hypothetical protein
MTIKDGKRIPRVTGVAATAPAAAAAVDTPAFTSQPGSERGSYVKKEAVEAKKGRKPSPGNSVPPNAGDAGSTASANGTARGAGAAAPAPAKAKPTPMSILKDAAAEEEAAEAGSLYRR